MKIKLKDKFWRYVDFAGLFDYNVVGIRQYEGDELYELECQTCTHGPTKCLLLCALDDEKNLQYVRMLNDNEDNSQLHFHTHSGQFFATKNEALIDKASRSIAFNHGKIAEIKKNLEYYEKLNKDQIKLIKDLSEELK